MIVRMHQLELQRVEALAGWPDGVYRGPVDFAWPGDAAALELFVLERDEHGRAVPVELRQRHLRGLIAAVAEALLDVDQQVVVRLDGSFTPDGLLPLVERLAGAGRFALSPVRRLALADGDAEASVRVAADAAWLDELCRDERIDLAERVRLRLFCVPAELVDPVLDIDALDDERWRDILPVANVMAQVTRGLGGIQVVTRRFDVQQSKRRLTRGLSLAWERRRMEEGRERGGASPSPREQSR